MLHSRTTLILAAMMFLLLALLVAWTTVGQRHRAVLWWCAGSALASTGIVLMGVRPWIPAWASYEGGNTSLLAALIFWAQSLRVMRYRGWSHWQVALSVALAGLGYSVLHRYFGPELRGVGMRVGLGGLALYTSWLALGLSRQLKSHNAAALAATYLILGLGLWAQLLLHGGGGPQPNPFSNTWDASLLAMIALMTSAVGHLCFIGLVLDSSIGQQVQAMQARAATHETSRLEGQLRELDRAGRMILLSGSLAHELNQPLTAALTHAQVAQRSLRMGKTDAAGLGALLDKVASGVQRASKILERIQAPERAAPAARTRVDLRSVAAATTDLFTTEWCALGLRVDRALGDKPLWSLADEVAISQVLVNLLRNATQATVESSPARAQKLLQVQCSAGNGRAQIVVRDHGPGLPEDLLAHWGEPFTGTRKQGLGLGLTISRAIAEQHGGTLTLRNHPEGGAQATLDLPMVEEAPTR